MGKNFIKVIETYVRSLMNYQPLEHLQEAGDTFRILKTILTRIVKLEQER